MEPLYDEFHINGYWWAFNTREGVKPEVIRVFNIPPTPYSITGRMAHRLGEADPYEALEFLAMMPIETTGWPEEPDADSPRQALSGYHWVLFDRDVQPEIVKVDTNDSVMRLGRDSSFGLGEFVFIRTIDTSSWPRE